MTYNNITKLVIGITGASGIIYGIRLLEILHKLQIETHLIITKSSSLTLNSETDLKLDYLKNLASFNYLNTDIAAIMSSGSFYHDGMIIAPCSIKTMSSIANCYSDSLISRAADVTLKERRKLVLMVRETPLHLGHLRLMTNLAEMGAIIAPAMPAFYTRPKSIEDLINHSLSRILDLFGIDAKIAARWKEDHIQ